MANICVRWKILKIVGSRSSIGRASEKTMEYILFLSSDGRERKGKLPVLFGGASPSSSEGYAEGYADERGVGYADERGDVAALSSSRGTIISLRFILLIVILKSGSRFQVWPSK